MGIPTTGSASLDARAGVGYAHGAVGENASIAITGPATADHTVPAEVLVNAILAVQRSVWLIAASSSSRELRERFTPEQQLRQKYTLRLSTPKPGSFDVPVSLSDERRQATFTATGGENPLTTYGKIWAAVGAEDLQTVYDLIQEESYRLRLFNEFRRMLPKRGDRWSVRFATNGIPCVELGAHHRPIIDTWLEHPAERQEMSVIGELRTIHLATKRVIIRYPPTSREIECSYRDELEDSIFVGRHGLFQVIGQFVLDPEGNPKELTDVRSIEPVDLSAAVLPVIELEGFRLVATPPLIIEPRLDAETKQSFEVDIEELGIFVSGSTREELLDELFDHLKFAWLEYAEAEDGVLSQDARDLKQALLSRFQRAPRSNEGG
jgi:hypothetical protein